MVTTSLRSVAVTWDPPIFLANGQVITPQTPRYQPGQVFDVGRHKIKYEARLNGKKLKCDFKIYVRRKWKYSLNMTACFWIIFFVISTEKVDYRLSSTDSYSMRTIFDNELQGSLELSQLLENAPVVDIVCLPILRMFNFFVSL